MAALPTGTVTFLFTDIEGSTTLLQRLGNRWIRSSVLLPDLRMRRSSR
jgi:class 3 adenylate cyclase